MKSNAECLRLRLVGLVIGMSLLTGCGTVSSERAVGVCPLVVEYGPVFQVRAAVEMLELPEASTAVEMLSDYAVMRDQARACRI